ncbi:NAD(P)H-dependent oxidoreductase [Marinobacterium arenosum]|uniref:NAD(P)H-dependent oxidoreductase n=1 Tax=Marinobacterium arenosum TaxID=2862496 RepID=UPI001C98A6EC|nr:NAD(P)H-dependent oxidoreductase [Marinobacterium arenosum]MBY4677447.1 NAD(P)H-dependent oxidoreductase [Marinobacterium arenosum]
MNTLVLLAHSDMENRSIANRRIITKLKAESHVEVRDLYRLYPDFDIDIEAEQRALQSADLIVLQYPIHWYNAPGLLKEWMDRVLQYGFAYGSQGDKLHGKGFMVSVTVGGPENSYQEGGDNSFPMTTFLTPLQQTAKFCGMQWQAPVISHDMVYIPGVWNEKEAVALRAENHADRLLNQIEQYRLMNAA